MARKNNRRVTRRVKKQRGGRPRTEKAKRAQLRSQERKRQLEVNNQGGVIPNYRPLEIVGNNTVANNTRVNNMGANNTRVNNASSVGTNNTLELNNIRINIPTNNSRTPPSLEHAIGTLKEIQEIISGIREPRNFTEI